MGGESLFPQLCGYCASGHSPDDDTGSLGASSDALLTSPENTDETQEQTKTSQYF